MERHNLAMQNRRLLRAIARTGLAVFVMGHATSCGERERPSVTLYTSLDAAIVEPIAQQFERDADVAVRIVTMPTAAELADRLRSERAAPAAHLWWSDESLHTAALASEGQFTPLTNVAVVSEVRDPFKDAQLRWAGVGLRARVIATHESAGSLRGSIDELAEPKWKGQVAIATPTNDAGFAAVLYAAWGDERADAFYRSLRDNDVTVLNGPAEVAAHIGAGRAKLGLTGEDDLRRAQRNGGELWEVVPDQADGQVGTVAMPTTVALIARSQSPEAARRLAAVLLSAATERRLIDAGLCSYSVRADGERPLRAMTSRADDAARRLKDAPARAAGLLDKSSK